MEDTGAAGQRAIELAHDGLEDIVQAISVIEVGTSISRHYCVADPNRSAVDGPKAVWLS